MELDLHPGFLQSSKRRRYLLGISGGRDSVALLHILLDHGFTNLVLCHLNHGLRGKESGKDTSFVRQLARKHALPCEIGRVNLAQQMKKSGESMELAARNARHLFFRDCARTYRCKRILLAHHADDQAETILFNLLRGSAGLKGMDVCSQHKIEGKSLEFIRPLLETTRHQIDGYLADHQIRYRDDMSNAEPIAARNRIRNEALPLLEEIMGRDIRPALLRSENISSGHEQCIRELLEGSKLEDPQGRLFLPKLQAFSHATRMTALQIHLKKNGIREISHDVLERCCSLIDDTSVAKVNLPGGLHFRRKAKRLFID